MGIPCVGKEYFPLTNEFTLGVVREGARKLGLDVGPAAANPGTSNLVPARPPALCPGCPHRSTFYSLRKLRVNVAGDIGCYSIGVLPPFNAIDTLGCMGASLGVTQGVDAVGANTEKQPWVAVIGDSTFFHAGMPALANIIYNRGASTVMILDNDTTAMTGQQENPGTGKTLQGNQTKKIDIEAVVRGMGVEDVFIVDAFDEPAVEKTIKKALAIKDRVSVIISRGPCVFLEEYPEKFVYEVSDEKCNGCSMCFRTGCPAIFKGELDVTTKQPKALIDPLLCIGCDVCAQVCPHDAIFKVAN
jgi:indolepyruvate ferredoxin oxidoreductase alpha subunit